MYKVEKGIISCDNRYLPTQQWFGDDHLAFGYDKKGITQINFYNKNQEKMFFPIFKRRIWDVFSFYIEDDGLNYIPAFEKVILYPYGLECVWRHKDADYVYRVMAIEESIVWSFRTPANIPENIKIKLVLFEHSALIGHDAFDQEYYDGGNNRQWQDWVYESGILSGGFNENDNKNRLEIAVSADFDISHKRYGHGEALKKHVLQSGLLSPSTVYNMFAVFEENPEKAVNKINDFKKNVTAKINAQYDRYQKIADRSPVLESPYEYLNNFFGLVPLYHETLKIKSYPGAIRAKSRQYWVWAWDGMTSNQSTCYFGDSGFVKEMLEFYENTADPEKGIVHAFKTNMEAAAFCRVPGQSMYITLLYQYYCFTQDMETLKKHYPFAVKIIKLIESRGGMPVGMSMYPDIPELTGETGDDFSAFNTTWYYCAVRGLEELAQAMGDDETAKVLLETRTLIEDNFLKLFFNENKGFIVNSVDATSLAQRNSYGSNSVKWENKFLSALLDPIKESALRFYEEHMVTRSGLRPAPLWDNAFDGDAYSLHCWWPVMGHYYTRLINACNRPDLIRQYIGYIEHWSRKLTVPEGIACFVDTDKPDDDNWASILGSWYGYSMRGWYEDIVHSIVGVEISDKGIMFHPYEGEEMNLLGIYYGDKRFDFYIKGSGTKIAYIEIDGRRIEGRLFLPYGMYKDIKYPKITVFRGR